MQSHPAGDAHQQFSGEAQGDYRSFLRSEFHSLLDAIEQHKAQYGLNLQPLAKDELEQLNGSSESRDRQDIRSAASSLGSTQLPCLIDPVGHTEDILAELRERIGHAKNTGLPAAPPPIPSPVLDTASALALFKVQSDFTPKKVYLSVLAHYAQQAEYFRQFERVLVHRLLQSSPNSLNLASRGTLVASALTILQEKRKNALRRRAALIYRPSAYALAGGTHSADPQSLQSESNIPAVHLARVSLQDTENYLAWSITQDVREHRLRLLQLSNKWLPYRVERDLASHNDRVSSGTLLYDHVTAQVARPIATRRRSTFAVTVEDPSSKRSTPSTDKANLFSSLLTSEPVRITPSSYSGAVFSQYMPNGIPVAVATAARAAAHVMPPMKLQRIGDRKPDPGVAGQLAALLDVCASEGWTSGGEALFSLPRPTPPPSSALVECQVRKCQWKMEQLERSMAGYFSPVPVATTEVRVNECTLASPHAYRGSAALDQSLVKRKDVSTVAAANQSHVYLPFVEQFAAKWIVWQHQRRAKCWLPQPSIAVKLYDKAIETAPRIETALPSIAPPPFFYSPDEPVQIVPAYRWLQLGGELIGEDTQLPPAQLQYQLRLESLTKFSVDSPVLAQIAQMHKVPDAEDQATSDQAEDLPSYLHPGMAPSDRLLVANAYVSTSGLLKALRYAVLSHSDPALTLVAMERVITEANPSAVAQLAHDLAVGAAVLDSQLLPDVNVLKVLAAGHSFGRSGKAEPTEFSPETKSEEEYESAIIADETEGDNDSFPSLSSPPRDDFEDEDSDEGNFDLGNQLQLEHPFEMPDPIGEAEESVVDRAQAVYTLRMTRIRQLQHRVFSLLNYFRSIQRNSILLLQQKGCFESDTRAFSEFLHPDAHSQNRGLDPNRLASVAEAAMAAADASPPSESIVRRVSELLVRLLGSGAVRQMDAAATHSLEEATILTSTNPSSPRSSKVSVAEALRQMPLYARLAAAASCADSGLLDGPAVPTMQALCRELERTLPPSTLAALKGSKSSAAVSSNGDSLASSLLMDSYEVDEDNNPIVIAPIPARWARTTFPPPTLPTAIVHSAAIHDMTNTRARVLRQTAHWITSHALRQRQCKRTLALSVRAWRRALAKRVVAAVVEAQKAGLSALDTYVQGPTWLFPFNVYAKRCVRCASNASGSSNGRSQMTPTVLTDDSVPGICAVSLRQLSADLVQTAEGKFIRPFSSDLSPATQSTHPTMSDDEASEGDTDAPPLNDLGDTTYNSIHGEVEDADAGTTHEHLATKPKLKIRTDPWLMYLSEEEIASFYVPPSIMKRLVKQLRLQQREMIDPLFADEWSNRDEDNAAPSASGSVPNGAEGDKANSGSTLMSSTLSGEHLKKRLQCRGRAAWRAVVQVMYGLTANQLVALELQRRDRELQCDRLWLLQSAWENEYKYQVAKRRLIEMLSLALANTLDRDRAVQLARRITSVMKRFPTPDLVFTSDTHLSFGLAELEARDVSMYMHAYLGGVKILNVSTLLRHPLVQLAGYTERGERLRAIQRRKAAKEQREAAERAKRHQMLRRASLGIRANEYEAAAAAAAASQNAASAAFVRFPEHDPKRYAIPELSETPQITTDKDLPPIPPEVPPIILFGCARSAPRPPSARSVWLGAHMQLEVAALDAEASLLVSVAKLIEEDETAVENHETVAQYMTLLSGSGGSVSQAASAFAASSDLTMDRLNSATIHHRPESSALIGVPSDPYARAGASGQAFKAGVGRFNFLVPPPGPTMDIISRYAASDPSDLPVDAVAWTLPSAANACKLAASAVSAAAGASSKGSYPVYITAADASRSTSGGSAEYDLEDGSTGSNEPSPTSSKSTLVSPLGERVEAGSFVSAREAFTVEAVQRSEVYSDAATTFACASLASTASFFASCASILSAPSFVTKESSPNQQDSLPLSRSIVLTPGPHHIPREASKDLLSISTIYYLPNDYEHNAKFIAAPRRPQILRGAKVFIAGAMSPQLRRPSKQLNLMEQAVASGLLPLTVYPRLSEQDVPSNKPERGSSQLSSEAQVYLKLLREISEPEDRDSVTLALKQPAILPPSPPVELDYDMPSLSQRVFLTFSALRAAAHTLAERMTNVLAGESQRLDLQAAHEPNLDALVPPTLSSTRDELHASRSRTGGASSREVTKWSIFKSIFDHLVRVAQEQGAPCLNSLSDVVTGFALTELQLASEVQDEVTAYFTERRTGLTNPTQMRIVPAMAGLDSICEAINAAESVLADIQPRSAPLPWPAVPLPPTVITNPAIVVQSLDAHVSRDAHDSHNAMEYIQSQILDLCDDELKAADSCPESQGFTRLRFGMAGITAPPALARLDAIVKRALSSAAARLNLPQDLGSLVKAQVGLLFCELFGPEEDLTAAGNAAVGSVSSVMKPSASQRFLSQSSERTRAMAVTVGATSGARTSRTDASEAVDTRNNRFAPSYWDEDCQVLLADTDSLEHRELEADAARRVLLDIADDWNNTDANNQSAELGHWHLRLQEQLSKIAAMSPPHASNTARLSNDATGVNLPEPSDSSAQYSSAAFRCRNDVRILLDEVRKDTAILEELLDWDAQEDALADPWQPRGDLDLGVPQVAESDETRSGEARPEFSNSVHEATLYHRARLLILPESALTSEDDLRLAGYYTDFKGYVPPKLTKQQDASSSHGLPSHAFRVSTVLRVLLRRARHIFGI